MAKITRAVQKIFGSTAGANQIAQFGSLAAGTPAFTTDPTTIQALSNYLTGWFGGVEGGNSPAIEDMNALCFLFAYQLAYVMQTGVPEWNAATTYYIGSLVNDGSGLIYKSLVDTNLNHALTDTTRWSPNINGQYNRFVSGAAGLSSLTLVAGDSVLVTGNVTETVQVLVTADDVRIDFAPVAALQSSLTSGSLFKVTGARFRSANLRVKATGVLTSGNVLTELNGNDAIVTAGYFEIANAGIALTNVLKFGGSRNDVTSASIVATTGSYTNPYSDTGTNNDSRIRG